MPINPKTGMNECRVPVCRLHELLSYDRDSGVVTRKITTSHNAVAGSRAGTVSGKYRGISVDNVRMYEHRVVFAMIHGRWPTGEVDHINCDGLDNRAENLREASPCDNQLNRRLVSHSTSGKKGASYQPRYGNFRATIQIAGKWMHLGTFKTADDAHAAYMRAVQEMRPEFARAA